MANFPFYPFSYRNYYHYYPRNYINNFNNSYNKNINETDNKNVNETQRTNKNEIEDEDKTIDNKENRKKRYQKRSSKNISFANINLNGLLQSDLENPIIEILGIKLYLDDLIIISLLFFLYKEDVHDEILFGILILLLLD